MPVDYLHVDAIAAAVADIYAEAENALLALITRQLAAGGFDDETTWAARKLTEIRALQHAAQLLADELTRDGNVAVRRAVADGFRSGNTTALVDLTEQHVGDTGPAARTATQSAGTAVQALADATVQELRPVEQAILRATDDAYRRAVAGATARRLAGARDLRRAAQDAWAALSAQGITGFTDKAGRRWRLHTYAEMATRAAVARAAIVGQCDTWTAAGHRHCYVVDEPRECPICRPWETKILDITDGPAEPPAIATLAQAQADGLHHPNCFPAEVLVAAPSGLRAADSRWYEGELIVVHTAGGEELPVTPNHPILTPEGWVAAGALKVGDSVLRHRSGHERMTAGSAGLGPNDELIPARIGQVFDTLRETSTVPAVRVPGSAEQFHGDGRDGEVDVVLADRLLAHGELAQLGERVHDRLLVVGGSALGALLAPSPPREVLGGAHHAAHRVVGGGGLRGPLLGAEAGHPAAHRLAVADLRATGLDDRADSLLADAQRGRDLALELASQVATDRVVGLRRRQFSGHVFNLQTGDGWYIAAGLVVSNCRHKLRLWTPGTRIVAARQPEGPAGYTAEQEQRRLERGLRGWRERYAAAFDEQAQQHAAARIHRWTAALAEHLDAHPRLPRVSYREHPGAGYRAPRAARTRRDRAHLAGR